MRKLVIAFLLMMLLAASSYGAEQWENAAAETGEKSAGVEAIENMILAEQLAELGRAQKSPLLLASAAQILSGVGTAAEAAFEKTEEDIPPSGRQSSETPEKSAAMKEQTAESLYAEAIAMARDKGDAVLAEALENQSRVGAPKGAGSLVHYDRVRARCNDIYHIRFRGGQRAMVRVRGDGDPTALYVYDEYGNLVGRDTDSHTQSTVRWTPRWTGDFKIVVQNRMGVYIDYVLYTN